MSASDPNRAKQDKTTKQARRPTRSEQIAETFRLIMLGALTVVVVVTAGYVVVATVHGRPPVGELVSVVSAAVNSLRPS